MKAYIYAVFVSISLIFIGLTGLSQDIPRPEYPRPQFERETWMNLNGEWTYSFDPGESGKEDNWFKASGFYNKIRVPFCPESKLSGVQYTGFINVIWYHRKIDIPADWNGKRIHLHFGAVDYQTEVYIDGVPAGFHFGGTSSFSLDITPFARPGDEQHLVVYVKDDVRGNLQPAGKQSHQLKSYSCLYTRTTGIWQTVWMEAVDKQGLASCKITPDLDQKQFVFNPVFYQENPNNILKISIKDAGKMVAAGQIKAGNSSCLALNLKTPKLWSPENPFLYDIIFELVDKDGKVLDQVISYAGMRKVHVADKRIYLNNQPYFLRFVLDQGFYPDGIWTAPTDEALKNDILMSIAAGFNGARLHQKVFEERFHYWADRLGYLTWGETSSWGFDPNQETAARNFLIEWEEILHRDINHPSIIGWSPFNEFWEDDQNLVKKRLVKDGYLTAKRIDPTRPVVTVSGGYHIGLTDIFAEHTYEQDPQKLHDLLKDGQNGDVYIFQKQHSGPYLGEPYMIDEFGGIKWVKEEHGEVSAEQQGNLPESWGYGKPPQTPEEYYSRLEQLVDVLLNLDYMAGFCYTQLTDVEQEKNGIYTYTRETKFDMNRIRAIFSKPRK